ncbi:hypothetical protein K474DRAFT_1660717 [Panus rudis PR-1116 ss-1]|nr:hypothetical protein K474DRAFT_1660717 [Panus rudis PR-1116 ss-1]
MTSPELLVPPVTIIEGCTVAVALYAKLPQSACRPDCDSGELGSGICNASSFIQPEDGKAQCFEFCDSCRNSMQCQAPNQPALRLA